MKVIFLDIDGVLNSTRSAVAFKGYPFPGHNEDKFDYIAVELIRRICSKNVKIVLSSTWKMDKNYKKILNLPIIDKTPVLDTIRGEEIALWIKNNGEPEKWVILDDDSDMLESQMNNFVKTDHRNGLLFEDYEKICSILEIDLK